MKNNNEGEVSEEVRQGKGMREKSWADLVREIFPDAEDEFVEVVLWEHTGYPAFWNIPEDGASPTECCRKQLLEFKNTYQKDKG